MRYAYTTNGLAHHRLVDGLRMLAGAGCAGGAVTPDVHHLDPFADDALVQFECARLHADLDGLRDSEDPVGTADRRPAQQFESLVSWAVASSADRQRLSLP